MGQVEGKVAIVVRPLSSMRQSRLSGRFLRVLRDGAISMTRVLRPSSRLGPPRSDKQST
jgi:hypothetical protein